jgi:hypothetical protein
VAVSSASVNSTSALTVIMSGPPGSAAAGPGAGPLDVVAGLDAPVEPEDPDRLSGWLAPGTAGQPAVVDGIW